MNQVWGGLGLKVVCGVYGLGFRVYESGFWV